jgi:hypothetical protein
MVAVCVDVTGECVAALGAVCVHQGQCVYTGGSVCNGMI